MKKLPFDPSLMVYFRKRLTPEVLGEINEMIVRDAKERQGKEASNLPQTRPERLPEIHKMP